jgi:hypothetical protein
MAEHNEMVDDTGSDMSSVSDGYHSFDELYEHRNLLWINLVKTLGVNSGYRSRTHSDGSIIKGWFILGMSTDYGQITYHLPDRLWDLCDGIPELDRAPEWDGHSSDDVLDRLRALSR